MHQMIQADVYIYTTQYCPYCNRAKQILQKKGVKFREIPVDGNEVLRREMQEKAQQRTVPQIWINNKHIGGCTDLMALDAKGQLDRMLNEKP